MCGVKRRPGGSATGSREAARAERGSVIATDTNTTNGHIVVANPALEPWVRHAERFGVELVFETALGLGAGAPELSAVELVELARRLKAIDPRFNPARPDNFIELAGAEVRAAYLERLTAVLDPLGAPAPTRAGRACEWCGRSVAGRANRRTCSPACRKRLDRADGIGPFSRPDVTPSDEGGLRVAPGRFVTPTPREHGRFETENRGVGDFREVAAIGGGR